MKIRNSGIDAVALKVDCSDKGEVGLLGIHAWMTRGVDALILNHGEYRRIAAEDMELEDLERTMRVNFERLSKGLENFAKAPQRRR